MGDEDKSFEASQSKLKKAREMGQTIKSRDLTAALFIVVLFFLLISMAPFIWQTLCETFIAIFEKIPDKTLADIGWQPLIAIVLRAIVLTLVPFLIVAFLVALTGELIQVGLMFTTQPLIPKFDRLNPVNGFKNIFSKRTIIELVKNIIKVSILLYLGYWVVTQHIEQIVATTKADNVFSLMMVLGDVLKHYIFVAGMAFFIIGGFDYLYQRQKFLGDQKMSFKEVKDEYKQQEGDPMVKHMLRQRRMQMMQRQMLEAVPTADVVATNPIHVAVALKYNPDSEAPQVVAKGAELFAQRIKDIAQEHGIPIVENPTVARTLYQVVDIDQPIPPDLYQAVAEILLFAWKQTGKAPPLPKAAKTTEATAEDV
jgi:flagellar biosynthetic protein FlhB